MKYLVLTIQLINLEMYHENYIDEDEEMSLSVFLS